MRYRLDFTDTFHNDLFSLASHIAEDSPIKALEYRGVILRHTEKELSFMPTTAPLYTRRLPAHLKQHEGEIRKLVINKTTLVYLRVYPQKKTVTVLHARRSWKPLEIT